MENQPDKPIPPPERPVPRQRPPTSTLWLVAALLLVAIAVYHFNNSSPPQISYGQFVEEVKRDNVAKVELNGQKIYGVLKTPLGGGEKAGAPSATPAEGSDEAARALANRKFITIIPTILFDGSLDKLLQDKLGKEYKAVEPADSTGYLLIFYLLVTGALFVGLWFMFRRTRDQMLGGGLLSGFIKSPARRYETGAQPVTFADVAGLEGVKNDLQEIVQFLKSPEQFQRLGGHVPKGVLLMGPPGTGKTLLGRAVAGEAGVPFFSISGSEFIQMFVGVGAGRVRDMFATAKAAAPAILFIDEIDAVGRHRGAGLGGGNDEREQTLNQILSEMDGFAQNESVIVMAATNRPDVLDPALLRPGRFDRHITVDRPHHKGRLAIFKVHSRKVVLGDDVDLERLASGSVGLTGADIRNLVNEAALWATRQGKDRVEMVDFEHARDKILIGSKRDEVLTGKEKLMTAYHEAGHTLLAWMVAGIDRVHKVSIIPRGRSLGATHLLPEEDRVNISEGELHVRLLYGLGGRAAEKLIFNEYSAGAENDLMRATEIARRMVTHWGMSERIGPVAFRTSEENPFLGREMTEPREFSEHTAQVIDEEIGRILRDADARAQQLLGQHRDKLTALATTLEREETLDEAQIEAVLGPPAHRANGANGTNGTQSPSIEPKPAEQEIKPVDEATP